MPEPLLPREIRASLHSALAALGVEASEEEIVVERPKNPAHGDYASGAAMVLGKRRKENPRALAERLAAALGGRGARVEVAGPGFLNFRFPPERYHALLAEILADPGSFLRAGGPGAHPEGTRRRVSIEFVSANPTGPLNVVNARAAAVGDTIARALDAAGFAVEREFYVNDHGNQADLLGESVLAFVEAAREGREEPERLPDEGYGGAYVGELARAAVPLLAEFTRDDPGGPDDALLRALRAEGAGLFERAARASKERGAPLGLSPRGKSFLLREFALESIFAGQRRDLEGFGVTFDRWFRESELHGRGAPAAALSRLREAGHVYDEAGAVWFRSTAFGDDQDRVLVKKDGAATYFLADIAYHQDKRERGYDTAIDIWGPDHHGHILRMKAAAQALGAAPDWLEILIVQQVNLLREGRVVKMSKRRGEFVTLAELTGDVGRDVARWFFLMRRCESHLDFDLDLAKKESDENPVFYVQYAHARITGLFLHAAERGAPPAPERPDASALAPLVEPEAVELVRVLHEFPATVFSAALLREPHRIVSYLTEVATAFHAFYHVHQIVVPGDDRATAARLALCRGAQSILREGLTLLGISAPERM